MNDPSQIRALCQAFECFRVDSAAHPESFPVSPRSHYFSEILLVRSGTCRITRGSHVHTLREGEMIYFASMVRHSVDSADGKPVVYDVIKYSAARLREIPAYLYDLRSVAFDSAQSGIPVQMDADSVRYLSLDHYVGQCIEESEKQMFGWELQVRGFIYLIVNAMARFWLYKRETLDPGPAERDPLLYIPAYIEEHISDPLRVEDLAAECGLSYPWFAKRFRQFYGLSCKQFIEQLRTEAVEQFLTFTDLDLNDISSRTGYTDCSHMVKDFRRMTGMTPGQYRSLSQSGTRAAFSPFPLMQTRIGPERVDTQGKNG